MEFSCIKKVIVLNKERIISNKYIKKDMEWKGIIFWTGIGFILIGLMVLLGSFLAWFKLIVGFPLLIMGGILAFIKREYISESKYNTLSLSAFLLSLFASVYFVLFFRIVIPLVFGIVSIYLAHIALIQIKKEETAKIYRWSIVKLKKKQKGEGFAKATKIIGITIITIAFIWLILNIVGLIALSFIELNSPFLGMGDISSIINTRIPF